MSSGWFFHIGWNAETVLKFFFWMVDISNEWSFLAFLNSQHFKWFAFFATFEWSIFWITQNLRFFEYSTSNKSIFLPVSNSWIFEWFDLQAFSNSHCSEWLPIRLIRNATRSLDVQKPGHHFYPDNYWLQRFTLVNRLLMELCLNRS